jgi:hypothetical protein
MNQLFVEARIRQFTWEASHLDRRTVWNLDRAVLSAHMDIDLSGPLYLLIGTLALYVAVRFGVRDGIADADQRRRRGQSGD